MGKVRYFKTYADAEKVVGTLKGHKNVNIREHDFGVIAEEAGEPRVQYYMGQSCWLLRLKQGYCMIAVILSQE
jgi:hypothetical protein